MFFTDPEDRHEQQLFGELHMQNNVRTLEEQQRLRKLYLEKKGINYDLPGTERHDTGEPS